MGDWTDIARNIFGLVAVIAGGIAAAYYANVRTLRDAIGDRDKRIEGLEGRVKDLEADLTTEKAEHVVTRGDLESLKKVVTGETHWVSIEQQIDHVLSIVNRILDNITGRRKKPDALD